MSTDIVRRDLARELDHLTRLAATGSHPVTAAIAWQEGPLMPGYARQVTSEEGQCPVGYEAVTDAVFHPSVPRLGLTHRWWSAGLRSDPHRTRHCCLLAPLRRPCDFYWTGGTLDESFLPGGALLESRNSAEAAIDRLSEVLPALPPAVARRVGIDPNRPPDGLEAIFHLGLHFPTGGFLTERFRFLTGGGYGPNAARVAEASLQRRRVEKGSRELFPGVMVCHLKDSADVLSAAAAAVQLLLDAIDATRHETTPRSDPAFARLREEFAARADRSHLQVRWLRLTSSFAPPADEWATCPRAEGGGGGVRQIVLAHRYADRVVCDIAGPGLEAFLALADRSGALLPAWPADPYPAVLGRPGALARHLDMEGGDDASTPGSANGVYGFHDSRLVTDHQGNVERWVGWVLAALVRHYPRHLRLTTSQSFADEWGVGEVVLEGIDLFAASALAIEATGLLPTPASSQVVTTSPAPLPSTVSPIPERRVRCSEEDRSVWVDGKCLVTGVELNVFRFFRAIADAYPDAIPYSKIAARTPGLHGKHPTRDLKNRLPRQLGRMVCSSKHGYSLDLQPGR